MADIGLNPPKAGNLHSRTGVMQDALASFGAVVVTSADGTHADMQTTTSAGATGVMGVVTSQGDPNNSGLFAVGDEVSVRDLGDVEIQVEDPAARAVVLREHLGVDSARSVAHGAPSLLQDGSKTALAAVLRMTGA